MNPNQYPEMPAWHSNLTPEGKRLFLHQRRPAAADLKLPAGHGADLPQALLRQAAQTIAARGAERDTAGAGQQQERSMAATVAAFNAIEGLQLTERQGWAFMQTLKLVRASTTARNGKYNADDYLDGAAYAALGAECASRSVCDAKKEPA